MTKLFTLSPDGPRAAEAVPAGAVFALGHFDGVHRGHRALFDEARRLSEELFPAAPVVAWSLSGLDRGGFLTTDGEKCRFFRLFGADCAVFEDFSEIRDMPGDRFFRERLRGPFSPAAVVCGFNFTFGRGASSGPRDLCRMAEEAGIRAAVCPPVTEEGVPVSSTRVREAVRAGRMEEAAALLGHPYMVRGPVLHGHALGRTIGIPTLNQRLPEGKIAPPRGVYASLVLYRDPDGRPVTAPGISNLGSRPTVNGDADDVTLETHLEIDCGDLYGAEVTVWLGKFLRPERKFASVDALKTAIAADSEAARPARERLKSGFDAVYHEDDLLLFL